MAKPVVGNLSGDELLYARNATVQSLSASASVQTLLAANLARKGGFLMNDADKACYVKFGTAASTTSFTEKIAIGGKFNLADGTRVYTGVLTVIWDADPTGALRVTELS